MDLCQAFLFLVKAILVLAFLSIQSPFQHDVAASQSTGHAKQTHNDGGYWFHSDYSFVSPSPWLGRGT